ncbi:MAG: hypothetical protein IT380_10980 [Myxococcales bacterium]|nr:hypothetical protein [Myxococcales bacterium]
MSTDPSARTLSDLSGEKSMQSVQAQTVAPEVQSVVDMHRRIAARLLAEGAPVRAFNELVRASRAVTMNRRLASSLTRMALLAQTYGPAALVLNQGLEECGGAERVAVLRQLARLTRRAGHLEESREALVHLLAERPGDRRARAVLNALLEREGRWDELDASLEKEIKEALRRGATFTASRASLRRARMWDEQRQDPARAALRYGQAAQYAEQASRFAHAFPLRLLWLRALKKSAPPRRALEDGVKLVLAAGDRAGQAARARAMIGELGLSQEPSTSAERPTASLETSPVVEAVPEPGRAAPAAAPGPRRISTQIELMAIADDVARIGKAAAEVAAVLSAAAREGPDPQAAKKLEAHYIARGAWRELARFYKDAIARAQAKPEKAAWAEKLAELLESELQDPAGAAQAWGDVVSATGDTRAVSEQVRLLAQSKDSTGVRHALDEGVKRAQSNPEKARALVLRAEEALTRREVAAARRDFEAALALVSTHAGAAAGLAELAAVQGDVGPVRALEKALAAIPRRASGRGELYRRLARLAGTPLNDQRLSRAAWTEVLAELPGDEEATAQVLQLTRGAGDDVALEQQLRELLEREPRGPKSRTAWLELVALLDRAGRGAEALAALKNAVRFEPGHRAAWLAYADRLLSLGGRDAEAAWALEHAATATEDRTQRLELWRRLARLTREALKDDAKAATFSQRADRLQQELAAEAPPKTSTLPGGPLVVPRRPGLKAPAPAGRAPDFEMVAKLLQARVEADPPSRAHNRVPDRIARQLAELGLSDETPQSHEPADVDAEEAGPTRLLEVDELDDSAEAPPPDDTPLPDDSGEVQEVGSSDVEPPPEEWPHGDARAVAQSQEEEEDEASTPRPVSRRTQELPVALGDPDEAVPPSFGPSPSKALSKERKALFERVRAEPLEADGYRLLAEHFDTGNDPSRSSLMLEIARALEGDPNAAPRTPRLILNATDRLGLKHPSLRGEAGELMGLVGAALCRLYPATGKAAGTDEEFNLEAGKGARAAADALLAAVRILGLRAPDVYVAEDAGPPFSLAYAGEPRLLVGKLAVKKETDAAELRFFAGRALFTQLPELMALRNLRRDQLLKGLQVIADVAAGRAKSAEARVAKEAVTPRAWERVRELIQRVGRKLNYAQLAEGARYSSNRAGLVVCGGIAPAVAALRVKRALPAEMMALVRFAASERYLQLRGRIVPRK